MFILKVLVLDFFYFVLISFMLKVYISQFVLPKRVQFTERFL